MVRVGILGAGFMGEMHSNVYANLEGMVKLVAVCDYDTGKAGKIAIPRGATPFSLSNFEKFINSGIELVDICIPTYSHAEYTIKVAEAGKHVLCEKPIALSLEEADRMIEAIQREKVKFMVAHCIRFWPEYIILKEYVEKKKLGKLKSLFLSRLSPTPTWTWSNWIVKPEKSGGAVLDLHIHDTDFVTYLLGIPDSVYSKGTTNKNGLSHIYTTYNYNIPNLAIVSEGGWDMPEKFPFNMSYLAIFEGGILSFSSGQQPNLLCYINGKETFTPEMPSQGFATGIPLAFQELKSNSGETKGNISALGGYFNEIKYFVECIEKAKYPEIVTPKDARESLRIILAEIKSVETGEIISLK